jgi:hypothetical protein
MSKEHIMADGARSRRREREAAFLWIGWGSLYLVHAFVWAVRLEWPPARDLIWGPVVVYWGWMWLRRPPPPGAHWSAGRKWFFLVTALYGVYILTIGVGATDNRVSWATGLIGGVLFLAVGMHTLVGEWIDDFNRRSPAA